MLTLREARDAAMAEFAKLRTSSTDPIEAVILDEHTIEKEWGWVFCWQSREFVESGDCGSPLVGNAPLIVNRFDGSVHPTGTARPIQDYIAEYERALHGRT
jgi:Immunity protein 35